MRKGQRREEQGFTDILNIARLELTSLPASDRKARQVISQALYRRTRNPALTKPGVASRLLPALRVDLPTDEGPGKPEKNLCENTTQETPESKASHAKRLIDLLPKVGLEMFRTPGDEVFFRYPVNGHREVQPINSSRLEGFLANAYFKHTDEVIPSSALTNALRLMEYQARAVGTERSVSLRIAEGDNGKLYLDLSDREKRAVEIDAEGWRVVSDPPVLFRQSPGMEALPVPTEGGSLDSLRPFVNCATEEDFRLLVGFLIGALHPSGPYPVLVLNGEHGSAKSTTAQLLRRLIDPNTADLRGVIDGDNLRVAARNSRVVVLDNVSGLTNTHSDEICRLATGGGGSKRQLYSDADEVLFNERRPAILNGIPAFVRNGDLRDRAVIVTLPPIPKDGRRTERELREAFEQARPALLGLLCSAVSVAIRRMGERRLTQNCRLADFAEWVEASSPALSWPDGEFVSLLAARQEQQAIDALAEDALTQALLAFGEPRPKVWEGSCADLLTQLTLLVSDDVSRSKEWPDTARGLRAAIDRRKPELRQLGVFVEEGKRSNQRRRLKLIFRTDEEPLPSREEEEPGGATIGSDACGAEPAAADPEAPPQEAAFLVSGAEVSSLLPMLERAEVIGLDLETTGFNPRQDRVRLLSLATYDGQWVIDCESAQARLLFPLLARKRLIFHNGKFDLGFLAALGFEPAAVSDTMLLSQILCAGTGESKGFHSLAACVERELGVSLAKELQKADWSGELTAEMVAYAAKDAAILLPLERVLRSKVAAAGLEQVTEIEEWALPALVWMENAGVGFDAEAWMRQARAAEEEAERLRQELGALAPRVNWNSPAQVKKAFAGLGCSLAKTDDDALAACEHPAAAVLRQYRSARKRASSYGDKWLSYVQTGRIHPSWLQARAASGRMACCDPNLQQVPRAPEYRACFIAPPRRVLIKADYSQIELRIAAKIADEAGMMEAYRNGDDLHTLTARKLTGKEEVSKAERQLAKAVNFGLLYGMGAAGFQRYAKAQYGVSLSLEEATQHRETFFRTYPGLALWHAQVRRRKSRETRTLADRRRLLGSDTPDTERLNTPVQGTGADGLKFALGLLWLRRQRCPSAVPVIACHDEIVIECDEGEADAAREWLVSAMKEAMEPLIAPVPVEVEATVGRTWGG